MSHSNSRPSPFLEQIRKAIRVRHYSIRTEQSYIHWIVRFIHFHDRRHPSHMGEQEVEAFLSHLAVERDVAASTQNQALNALNFLYKVVLQRPLHVMPGLVRAKRPQRLPVVLTQEQLGHMDIRTTQIYTHVLNRGGAAVLSPLGSVLKGNR